MKTDPIAILSTGAMYVATSSTGPLPRPQRKQLEPCTGCGASNTESRVEGGRMRERCAYCGNDR